MSEQRIVISENGPYLVSGSVALARKAPVVSEHGEPLAWKTPEPIETKDRYALCRCGDRLHRLTWSPVWSKARR